MLPDKVVFHNHLCVNGHEALSHDSFIHFFSFQDDNYGAEEVENLKSLVSNLRQLLDLHKKYNCRLSLSVFEKV